VDALKRENNVEVLRNLLIYAIEAGSEWERKYHDLTNDIEKGKQGVFDVKLLDQYQVLRRKFYGFGRETNPEPTPRPVGHEGQKLNAHSERPHQEELEAGSNERLSKSDLPEVHHHEMKDAELMESSKERAIPVGAEAWKKLNGVTEDVTEITVVERVYKKVIHKKQKYKLKDEYNDSDKDVIITARGPVKVKPGMEYSLDFALSVVSDKYEYHQPLERQRRKMEEAGLNIDTKTLYNMCESVREHTDRVLPRILQNLMDDYCGLHLDESPWNILGHQNREASSGYMWVASNRKGAVFRFEPTRSGEVPKEWLKNYDGAIICDAYGGYSKVKRETHVRGVQHCWAHARREFFDRYEDYPNETLKIIALIDLLFDVESEARGIAEVKERRRTKSKAIVDEIRKEFIEMIPRFLPESGLIKAINYCLNHWDGLTYFLKDASVPLSNNDAERALRHIVMGRKNFNGSKTIDGADTAASLYSLIESCKRVGLTPTEYLRYLITEHWYHREPMTPCEYSINKFGANTKSVFPEKSEWRIEI
jgi:transposase